MTPAETIRFEGIGTHWEIDIYEQVRSHILEKLTSSITQRVEEYDKTYSRFRNDSLAAAIAKHEGTYTLPEDGERLMDVYTRLYEASEGKVTPLVGDLLAQAGYDSEYSLTPRGKLKAVDPWPEIMTYSHPVLTTSRPVVLDFGAAGKGYLVDIIGGLLDEAGIGSYLVDGSGDMLQRRNDGETARIGLEHPLDPSQVIGIVDLGNESICGSAGNRRQWAGLHHIMDPHTAEPAKDVLAVWVVAGSAIVADGLATALFFTRPERLRRFFDFEYVLIRSNLSCQWSSGLRGEIFSEEKK